MKTKTTSLSFSQAAHLLLIASATLASALFSLGSAKAQSAKNVNLINTGCTVPFGNTYQTLYWNIPTDGDFNNSGIDNIVSDFSVQNLSFSADSTLTVDGTLTVKQISCDAPNAKMILCPNALVDLEGSTLTASSLTLADGTEIMNGTYSFNDDDNVSPAPADRLDSIPSYEFSNGAKLIHGTLIIDSNQPNALHLIESNEHGDQPPAFISHYSQN